MHTTSTEVAAVLQAANHWPWIAGGTVALLLLIIARFSRRRSQFGERL
jgi:hypothetical protein